MTPYLSETETKKLQNDDIHLAQILNFAKGNPGGGLSIKSDEGQNVGPYP